EAAVVIEDLAVDDGRRQGGIAGVAGEDAGAIVVATGGKDRAVVLQRQTINTVPNAQVARRQAAGAESGVELVAARGLLEASQREVAADVDPPASDHLPVGLDDDGIGRVVAAREVL